MDIQVRDSLFDLQPDSDPSQKTVTVRRAETPLYKVWVYLDGRDLPFVESVTYTLHSTFPDPVRKVERTVANPKCALIIWTWGIFEVKASVRNKQGRRYDLRHRLTYDLELSRGGLEYVYV